MPSGAGGLDANGIYKYGESDTAALASDLLNLLGNSVSTQIGPLLAGGLTAIVPTSATLTGGGFMASGVINFGGTTLMRANGVFTSRFRNYLMLLDIASKTSGSVTGRLSASGTDDTGSNYATQLLYANSTAVTAAATGASSSFTLDSQLEIELSGLVQLFSPALAAPTRLLMDLNSVSSSTSLLISHHAGRHNLSTAYDGISLTPSTGAFISGTCRFFGYNG